MIHVYYAAAGAESAKALTDEIKKTAKVQIHQQKKGPFVFEDGDLLVNWGGSTAQYLGGTKWLNKKILVNKLSMLRKFGSAGVPTVKFMEGKPGAVNWYARRFNHMDGDDLVEKLDIGDFYVQHVDTVREFRVHVFKGEIIRASLKVPLEDGADPIFKTGDKWGFSTRNWKADLGVCKKVAIDAVAALSYDFGGVDVALLRNGSPLVFEVNAAPWLGGDACRRYAKEIIALQG